MIRAYQFWDLQPDYKYWKHTYKYFANTGELNTNTLEIQL